ncbi:MAG: nitrate/nitrite transporter NrtS [Gallionella sp.]
MTNFLAAALSRRIITNALKIALVVGSLLNVINQGEPLLNGEAISWFHFLLNYVVPYCVATYSAAKNELDNKDIDVD